VRSDILALGSVAALAAAGVASRRRGSRSTETPLVVPVSLAALEKIYLSWRDGSGAYEDDACVFRVAGVSILPFGEFVDVSVDHCTWCELFDVGAARQNRVELWELTRDEKEELSSRLYRALVETATFCNTLSFPLPVYRGLRWGPHDSHGRPGLQEPEIRLQKPGKAWTPNRTIAQSFASGQHNASDDAIWGKKCTEAVLQGVIETPGDVDWVNTLAGYLQYTFAFAPEYGWRWGKEHVEEQVVSQCVRSVRRIA